MNGHTNNHKYTRISTVVHRKPNFSVASFQIAKRETELKCLAADKHTNKTSCAETLHCNTSDSEHVLSERSHRLWFCSYEMFRTGNSSRQERKARLGSNRPATLAILQAETGQCEQLSVHMFQNETRVGDTAQW